MKSTCHRLPRVVLCLLGALSLLPAWAQYKVVQPDGSVTYTDRPPTTGTARVIPMGRQAAGGAAPEATLPIELRQATARYPVTLYAAADCPPCDDGRRLLQQRGVPYAERRIVNDDDAAALERLVGGRSVPALSIGAQQLRGLSESDWNTYLDLAGYPRTSRLPPGWPAAEVTPLTTRAALPARAAAPAAEPVDPDAPAAPSPTPALRF